MLYLTGSTKCLREFNFVGLKIFCTLQKLIFVIVKDWFSLLDFCDFPEVAFH